MKCVKPMPKEKENIFESFNKVLSNRESLPYDDYVKWALYDPYIGYYTSQRLRIGRTPSTDFYTSTSLGKLWGKLIIEASQKLLSDKDPTNMTGYILRSRLTKNIIRLFMVGISPSSSFGEIAKNSF